MKKSSIKILYRLFAFLSDKTNGFAPFVKYKLTLGAVLIGLGACSSYTKKIPSSYHETTVLPMIPDSITASKIKKPEIGVSRNGNVETPNDLKKSLGERIKKESGYIGHEIDTSIYVNCYKMGLSIEELNPINSQKDDTIFTVVEQSPEFQGGEKAKKEFILKNLRFPDDGDGFTGKVIVTFVVEKDGTISDINVIKSLNPSFDKEAVRVVQLMPKWIPGRQRGKNVRVRLTLPINFRLTK